MDATSGQIFKIYTALLNGLEESNPDFLGMFMIIRKITWPYTVYMGLYGNRTEICTVRPSIIYMESTEADK